MNCNQPGSLLQAVKLPVMDCSSMGFPQSHGHLNGPCSLAGSSMGCRWDSVPPLTSKACKASVCHLTMGRRGIAAPSYSPPSSLTLVSTWLSLSNLTPLQYRSTPKPKELTQEVFHVLNTLLQRC